MRTGILEHHRYPVPVRAEFTAPERADVPPGEPDLPLHPGAGRQQPADRARRHRLARARLAHQADRLARVHRQGHAAQHGPPRARDVKPHRQAVELKQRLA